MFNYIENINGAKLKPQFNFTFLRKDDPDEKLKTRFCHFYVRLRRMKARLLFISAAAAPILILNSHQIAHFKMISNFPH